MGTYNMPDDSNPPQIIVFLILLLMQLAGVVAGVWLARHDLVSYGTVVGTSAAGVFGVLVLVALVQWFNGDAKGQV